MNLVHHHAEIETDSKPLEGEIVAMLKGITE